jgi:hypothetical protein
VPIAAAIATCHRPTWKGIAPIKGKADASRRSRAGLAGLARGAVSIRGSGQVVYRKCLPRL